MVKSEVQYAIERHSSLVVRDSLQYRAGGRLFHIEFDRLIACFGLIIQMLEFSQEQDLVDVGDQLIQRRRFAGVGLAFEQRNSIDEGFLSGAHNQRVEEAPALAASAMAENISPPSVKNERIAVSSCRRAMSTL